MSEPKVLIIGGQSLPIDLGSFVEAEGNALGLSLAPVQFDFNYRDIRFACRCESHGESAPLKLVGDVGPMPFSAESAGSRSALRTIVDAANEALGPTFKVAQGRLLIGTERELSPPITATALIGAIASFLLPASPYLTLIAEVVRPPLQPAKPGESALRREWRTGPTGRTR